jgi:hypothetical protein
MWAFGCTGFDKHIFKYMRIVLQGVLGSTDAQVHQVFEKFYAKSYADEIERRFEHFKARFWPRIRDSGSGGEALLFDVDTRLGSLWTTFFMLQPVVSCQIWLSHCTVLEPPEFLAMNSGLHQGI